MSTRRITPSRSAVAAREGISGVFRRSLKARGLRPSDPPEGRLRASRLAAWERSPRHSANPVSSLETPPYTSPHNNLHRFFVGTTQELPTSQK